jgi:hypothetical protein
MGFLQRGRVRRVWLSPPDRCVFRLGTEEQVANPPSVLSMTFVPNHPRYEISVLRRHPGFPQITRLDNVTIGINDGNRDQ